MKREWKWRMLTLIMITSVSSLEAISSGSPYNGIVDRNVFALKPPTPPPDPNANKPPEVPSNITLTGITTILGNKRALLHVAVPARPPEPAKEENYMLTEGQRDGSVEVLEINEIGRTVKVNNAGEITTLTFDKNGAKLIASAVPVPVPGQVVPPGLGSLGKPGGAAPNPGIPRTIPIRNLRSGGQTQTDGQPQQSSAFGSAQNVLASQAQFHNSFSHEEQVLMIEAQRMKFQDNGDPTAMILPPTEATPAGSSSSGIPELPQ